VTETHGQTVVEWNVWPMKLEHGFETPSCGSLQLPAVASYAQQVQSMSFPIALSYSLQVAVTLSVAVEQKRPVFSEPVCICVVSAAAASAAMRAE